MGAEWLSLTAADEQYRELYLRLRRENGHEPELGRKLGASLISAGFNDLKLAAVYESFAAPEASAVSHKSRWVSSRKGGENYL